MRAPRYRPRVAAWQIGRRGTDLRYRQTEDNHVSWTKPRSLELPAVRPARPAGVASTKSAERTIAPAPYAASNYAWLDVLKGIAILAVVCDHAFIVDDYLLWKQLYFHVSWFILLAGVSNTISAQRSNLDSGEGVWLLWARRLKAILPPYLWASILGYGVLNFRHPSLLGFLRQLLLFHALPPLYFIALLFQLLLIFPMLYWLIHRGGTRGRLLAAPLVLVLATVVSQRITLPWVLGAHYLFGASFLTLFALGIALAPLLTSRRIPPVLCVAVCVPLLALAEYYVLASNGDVMTHPPSNVLMLYAVALLGIGYALCVQFPSWSPLRLFAALGRRSLSIFLYHYLFLLPIFEFRDQRWTNALGLVRGQILLMILIIPVAIAGSILLAAASGRLWQACAANIVARLRRYRVGAAPRGSPGPAGGPRLAGSLATVSVVRPHRTR